jgi:flagellar motility protein MotE (MotC chaperone)
VIKYILVLKISFIVMGILIYTETITLGERKLLSADATKEFLDVREARKPKSQTLLEELFNLPILDTEKASKQEMAQYATLLEKRFHQVNERLKLLEEREAKMLQIEASVLDRLAKVDEEKRFIVETLQREKEIQGERLEQLVEFYKAMPAKKAAPVFEKLDKDLVVRLLSMMPQKQSMNILALMEPEVSIKLTEYYGRLRSGKEYEMLKEINQSLKDEFSKVCAE